MMTVYDHDNLPKSADWKRYRKVATTKMTPISGPCVVKTKEGDYALPGGWRGYLAIDSDGDPYPIALDVHARSYELDLTAETSLAPHAVSKAQTTTYVKFTEHNEQEGETWHFWIPTAGNDAALREFAAALGARSDADGEWPYEMDLASAPEAEVDAVVKHADGDYMATHNKLAGLLVISPEAALRIRNGDPEGEDELYKGGIRDFMKEPV